MALSAYATRFSGRTTNGTTALTGFGFQPKLIMAAMSNDTSDAGPNAGGSWSIGFAVSTASECCFFQRDTSAATTDSSHRVTSSRILSLLSTTTTIGTAADISAIGADGCTFNFTTTDGTARLINVFALGGSDLTNVFIKAFTSPTSTGNQSQTGVGFQPDLIIFLASGCSALDTTTVNIRGGFGIGISSSQRAAMGWATEDNLADSKTCGKQVADKVIAVTANDADFLGADLVSMDSDGFTINWSTVDGTARRCYAICLKGTFQKELVQILSGTTTGTTTYYGSFAPSSAMFFGRGEPTSTSIGAGAFCSVGGAKGSPVSQGGTSWASEDNLASSRNSSETNNGRVLHRLSNPVSNAIICGGQATGVPTFDNGLQINWRENDGSADREFWSLFLADAPSGTTYDETGSGGVTIGGTGDVQATYNVAGAGTVTAGGTGTATQTGSLTGSGTLTIGGTATPSVSRSLTGSGTLTIGGAGDNAVVLTYSDVGSGGVILGGVGTVQATYNPVGVGGVAVGGVAIVTGNYSVAGAGTLTVGGTGTPGNTQSNVGSGTLTIGGAGDVQATYTIDGSGEVVVGGEGDVDVQSGSTYNEVGSGRVTVGGAGTVQATYTIADTIQLATGGTGSIFISNNPAATGGVVIGGTGTAEFTYSVVGSVSLTVGGTGDDEVILNETGSGTLTIGGTATVRNVRNIVGAGGVVIAGTGTNNKVASITGSGGLIVGGAGDVLIVRSIIGSGGLFIGGEGLVVQVVITLPPAIDYRLYTRSLIGWFGFAEKLATFELFAANRVSFQGFATKTVEFDLFAGNAITKGLFMADEIKIGSDFLIQAVDVKRNGYNPQWLSGATVTWHLFADDGTTEIANGSIAYVSGTRAFFEGIIGESVTGGLTANTWYRLRITIEDGVNKDRSWRRLMAVTGTF